MKHDSKHCPQSSPPQKTQEETNLAIQQQDSLDLPSNDNQLVSNQTKINPSQKPRWRIWLYLLLAVSILAIGSVLFRQLQKNSQEIPAQTPQPARLSVRATEVRTQREQKFVFGDGYVWAVGRKHLTFETSGTITYVKKNNGRELREGDFVKAGDLLAKVDDRKLKAELAQARAKTAEAETQSVAAQANISQASASVEQAKADVIRAQADNESAQDAYRLAASELKRREKLFAQGAISISDVDVYRNKAKDAWAKVKATQAQVSAAQSRVKSANGQLESAKSQLQSTKATIASARAGQIRSNVQMEDTVIQAPFNGTVAHMNIREGDYWTPQRVLITGDYQSVVDSVPMILIDPKAYEVRLKLPAFDGTLVPLDVWEPIIFASGSYTGYSHNWKNCKPIWKQYLMASVQSESEARIAQSQGWRTFIIMAPDAPLSDNEILCRHTENDIIKCEFCMLCDGNSSKPNIADKVHGLKWKISNFVKYSESLSN